MTDAELITRLRADVDAHIMTGNGGMKRVEAICLAADRLTQLSEDNERLRQALLLIADVETPQAQVLFIARAALTQGQKEGAER